MQFLLLLGEDYFCLNGKDALLDYFFPSYSVTKAEVTAFLAPLLHLLQRCYFHAYYMEIQYHYQLFHSDFSKFYFF